MKLTTKARYGLKICLALGLGYGEGYIPISDIASQCGYSQKYTEKLMRHLKTSGIVKSEKGVTGGYMLSAQPRNLKIGTIIRALEDNLEFIDCISSDCDGRKSCPTHDVWRRLYQGINELLDSIALSDIIDDYHRGAKGEHSSEENNLHGQCSHNKC